MKQLFSFIVAFFCSFLGSIFFTQASYVPTSADTILLQTLRPVLEQKISVEPDTYQNLLPLLSSLHHTKRDTNPRLSFLLGQIVLVIEHTLQTPQEPQEPAETQSSTTSDADDKQHLCDQSLAEMTQDFHKKTFSVTSEQEIRNVLQQAKQRTDNDLRYEIVIAKGTYTLSNGFRTDTPRIIYRGATGNPDDVILQGKGMKGGVSHIFWIAQDDIMIGDMTLQNVANHAVQIHGEKDADRVVLHNLHVYDIGEQMIKDSYDSSTPTISADEGVVQCSMFAYTQKVGPQYYIGGIDVHHGKDRIVRDNIFKHIKSPEQRRAEHAIHFRSWSEGTQVYRNKILNCDRGIGFGLGDSGHRGGKIYDNVLYHDTSKGDVGIGLENAQGVEVFDNLIFHHHPYPNAIEYRFTKTDATITNNVTNKSITKRNDGTATLTKNHTDLVREQIQDDEYDTFYGYDWLKRQ